MRTCFLTLVVQCGHNRELPTSFCLSRKELFDLATRHMGLEFRYDFGKVLDTQNGLTLELASSHCVLCLNPIKGRLNIAF